jgi:transcription antitermination factor NusG
MSELKWYVLKAISGQENKVKNYIENEIKRLGLNNMLLRWLFLWKSNSNQKR